LTVAAIVVRMLCISGIFRMEKWLESLICSCLRRLERVKGIEPSSQAWEARILPLNHTRRRQGFFYQNYCRQAIPQIGYLLGAPLGSQYQLNKCL
jgi:hypothetical protein